MSGKSAKKSRRVTAAIEKDLKKRLKPLEALKRDEQIALIIKHQQYMRAQPLWSRIRYAWMIVVGNGLLRRMILKLIFKF